MSARLALGVAANEGGGESRVSERLPRRWPACAQASDTLMILAVCVWLLSGPEGPEPALGKSEGRWSKSLKIGSNSGQIEIEKNHRFKWAVIVSNWNYYGADAPHRKR